MVRWLILIQYERRRCIGRYTACVFQTTFKSIEIDYVNCPRRYEVRLHGLYCGHWSLLESQENVPGDALEGKVDLVLTDHPYNVMIESYMDISSHDIFICEEMSEFMEFARQKWLQRPAEMIVARGCSFANGIRSRRLCKKCRILVPIQEWQEWKWPWGGERGIFEVDFVPPTLCHQR